jgi:C1A family cysteine protease
MPSKKKLKNQNRNGGGLSKRQQAKKARKLVRKLDRIKARKESRRFRTNLGDTSNRKAIFQGRIKDAPDNRDYQFASRPAFEASRATTDLNVPVDLRSGMPAVRDQGSLGACTAFSATALFAFVRTKNSAPDIDPSPLFTYFSTRQIEGTVRRDSGAQIRNAVKATVRSGVVPLNLWPYNVMKFKLRPPRSVFSAGLLNQTSQYFRISDGSTLQMRQCLAEGFPFILGFAVYDSFFNIGSNGIMPVPDYGTETAQGGHAVICCGWTMIEGVPHYIFQNSWSAEWGDAGYFYMPESFIQDASKVNDLWTIRMVESGS